MLIILLIILWGCTNIQTQPPIQKTVEKTTISHEVPEAQYIQVNPIKLQNTAFIDDFKDKYVVFDAFFNTINPYGQGLAIGKYKKGWILFYASANAARYLGDGQALMLLIPKEKSNILFDLKMNQPIKVYGKVIVFDFKLSSTSFIYIEVQKIDVLSNTPVDVEQINPLIEYSKKSSEQPK